MCIQFCQIWREHDHVVCMWAVCVNVQTLENHPEMQYIIVCIYSYMHCISRHALSQTCIYMYMHGISHSGRGSGFQMKTLQTRFINVPKSHLHCKALHQSWQAATTRSNMFSRLQFSFLHFNFINHNVSPNVMSGLQSWLSGQSVAREIAGSDPNGALLP